MRSSTALPQSVLVLHPPPPALTVTLTPDHDHDGNFAPKPDVARVAAPNAHLPLLAAAPVYPHGGVARLGRGRRTLLGRRIGQRAQTLRPRVCASADVV